MILNLGSAIFNTETASGGGTPAWGTEMGQGDGYRFNFEKYQEFITALVYKSVINPQNRIYCPLGKGGNQAQDYEFVLASLFEKIFVNGKQVNNAKFVLLVTKKLVGANHVGRRTLKYNPRITLDNINYNSRCYDLIADKIGVKNTGSWFVSELNVRNQDELHFTAHILDEHSTYTFSDSNDRSKTLASKIRAYAESSQTNSLRKFSDNNIFDFPLQQIYFGAPGTGKSFAIDEIVNEDNSVRTTFHPDSDYSTFVGCYKPIKDKVTGEITYEFVPQAFTTAYVNAWKNLDEPYYLVIEEINRGNCAQIFGDIFQLLDRDSKTGNSSYKITPDKDLQDYLATALKDCDIDDDIKSGEKMQLPRNLNILATMNTSDQSLFPIDSAFKRRWDWKYIPIDYTDNGHYIACGSNKYKWTDFLDAANKRIESVTQSEDKKMGGWFVKPNDKEITTDKFVSKVVFYLWNDVFKDFGHDGNSIFKEDFDKFHKFFDNKGDVKLDVLEKFLVSLGLSPIVVDDELQDSADNFEADYDETIAPNPKSKNDNSKYSINGSGVFNKGEVAFEAVKAFAESHTELSADEVIRIWNNLGIGVYNLVISEETYNRNKNKTHEEVTRFERRFNMLTLNDESRIYVTKGFTLDTITQFKDAVNKQTEWNIHIERIS